MSETQLEKKTVNRTFIIAEVGPNHNGSVEMAEEYIDLLSELDIDAIKFQLSDPSKVYSKDSFKAEYQRKYEDSDSPLEMSQGFQLSKESHIKLSEKCAKKNIEYMCTAFDLDSLRFLNEILNISKFKIASGEIFSLDMLDYIRQNNKPVIMSTGMANIDEIRKVINHLNPNNKLEVIILHCVSSYPADLDTVNMNFMLRIKEVFQCPVGFSDHTLGAISSITAVAMGASVIEKHVTLDKTLTGPDHQASSTIEEFSQLVDSIRLVEKIKGNFQKSFSAEQANVYKSARKSIVSKFELNPGQILSEKDICFKRPGIGISPMDLKLVLGKKVKNKIFRDRLIKLEDLNEN